MNKPMVTPVILVMNDEYWLPYALESVRGLFKRYVIYDVGSTDNTPNIIDWFVEKEKNRAGLYVRSLPILDPAIQGIFRNSMIAEAQTDWYFILDGDEVYNKQDLLNGLIQADTHMRKFDKGEDRIYGVCMRQEFSKDLTQAYDKLRGHHRLYHRTAIWKGTHPGEEAVITQRAHREFSFEVLCYHFHNALRTSLQEETVPGRVRRKKKNTYHPGTLKKVEEVMVGNLWRCFQSYKSPLKILL